MKNICEKTMVCPSSLLGYLKAWCPDEINMEVTRESGKTLLSIIGKNGASEEIFRGTTKEVAAYVQGYCRNI